MKHPFFILLAFTVISSCKKDLRTKTYPLTEYNSSGMAGTVSFVETEDKNVTTVRLEASNFPVNVVHPCHLHTGTMDSLINTLVVFSNLQTSTGNIIREEPWNISYEEAIKSNTCFTVHNPANPANNYTGYYLGCNTGKNAP